MMTSQNFYQIFLYDGLPSAEFLELRRKFVMASMQLDANIQMISIAVRNTFKRKDWISTDAGMDWPYRGIPDMFAEWAEWLPNIVPYYTPTGHVQIYAKDFRQAAMLSSTGVQTTKMGALRKLLDTYSPVRLRHAIDYYHRAGVGVKDKFVADFEAESNNDPAGNLTDWVSRYETTARDDRMKDQQVATGMLKVPGPDRLSDAWKPWGGRHSKNALNQHKGWWESDLDEFEDVND